jgi:hypothetical protein
MRVTCFCLLAAICLCLSSCGGKGGDIVGKWRTENGEFLLDLRPDKKIGFYSTPNPTSTYEVSGSTITASDPTGKKMVFRSVVDGDEMTVTSEGGNLYTVTYTVGDSQLIFPPPKGIKLKLQRVK